MYNFKGITKWIQQCLQNARTKTKQCIKWFKYRALVDPSFYPSGLWEPLARAVVVTKRPESSQQCGLFRCRHHACSVKPVCSQCLWNRRLHWRPGCEEEDTPGAPINWLNMVAIFLQSHRHSSKSLNVGSNPWAPKLNHEWLSFSRKAKLKGQEESLRR